MIRSTSLEAYSKKRPALQKQTEDLIVLYKEAQYKGLVGLTDFEAGVLLGLPNGRVSARRGDINKHWREVCGRDLIVELGRKKNPETKINNIVWGCVE